MSKLEAPKSLTDFPLAVIKSMIGLATSGFGVVVALAWNEFIQNAVKNYIDPYLGKNSGMISLFIYALVVTTLAVVVTMQLTSLQSKFEQLEEKVKIRSQKKKAAKSPATK
jgi:hypothetical protein